MPESDSFMKWVTRATAVFALMFAVLQMVRTVVDVRDRRRQITELTGVEAEQKRSGDYERAWATLDQAVKIAESGGLLARLTGQLSTEARDLRAAQENLAMAWLDNLRLAPNQKFSDVVDRLAPVITRGVTTAAGPRKSDLLAHLGWASFLQTRDGKPGADPEQQYRDALAADRANPYAHAYLGHWLLWKGAPLDQGDAEFEQALASGRAKDYVRTLQLAALSNRGTEAQPRFVATVNDMRKHGEAVDATVRAAAYNVYTLACGFRVDAEAMRALVAAAPPAEQADTLRELVVNDPRSDTGRRSTSEACVATLLEAAGDRAGAIDAWQAVRKDAAPGDPNGLVKRADVALRRLAR
ncbi:MAG: hypothetical protein ACHQO8_10605 [Vicinamibacterales bacterium]